jgi:TRAP-type uncharacterized transport system fused permease subunit
MVTPPIAIGAFFAASIAKANPMKTALTSMRLGWTAYIIPFLFVTTPSLLLIGETSQIVITVISALVGVWAISVGFAGYFKDKLNFILRVGFVISGGLFLFPNLQGGDTSIIPKVVGLGLLVALLLVASFMKKTTSQLSPNSTQP